MAVNIEDVDIDVEDWIDGTSFTQARVTIHRNPALYAEYAPLLEKIEAAEADLAHLEQVHEAPAEDESSLGGRASAPVAPEGERSLGDKPAEPGDVVRARETLDVLYAQAEALHERYESDREVWTLRALDQSEIADVVLAHPDPERPKPLAQNANATARKRHDEKRAAWRVASVEAEAERNLAMVQLAVMSVDVNGTEKPAPTLDGLRRLTKRPHGTRHFQELYQALAGITGQEVAIPAPKSRRGSSDAPA